MNLEYLKNRFMSMSKKSKMLFVSLLLIMCVIVCGAVAFIIADTEPVVNTFDPAKVSCVILEDITTEEKVKQDVRIQNTGDIEAYIRAEVVATWRNADGEIYAVKPKKDVDYIVSFAEDSGWFKKDGYYYYENIVAPKDKDDDKDKTAILIDRFEQVEGQAPEGYYLSVEILAEAIQAKGESLTEETAGSEANIGKFPVELAWGVSVDANGKLTN